MKSLISLLQTYQRYGWIGLWAYWFPVYFTQDSNSQNNGYDILSVRKPKHWYYKGTWSNCTEYYK